MKNTVKKNAGYLLVIFLWFTIAFLPAGCKKEAVEEKNATSFNDLRVPEGFDWSMRKAVALSIGVSDTRFGDAIHVVAVYDQNGELISKGAARGTKPFETTLDLPVAAQRVYLIKTAPDGSRVTQTLELNKKSIATTLSASAENTNDRVFDTSFPPSPGCTTGVDVIVGPAATTNQVLTIANGQTLGLTGDFTGKQVRLIFENGGGTVRICGTNVLIRQITNLATDQSAQNIVVTQGGSATFYGIGDPLQTMVHWGSLTNYGTVSLAVNAAVDFKKAFNNYGVFFGTASNSKLLLESGGTNYGALNTRQIGVLGTFKNYGDALMSTENIMAGTWENFCKTVFTGNTYQTGNFINHENAYLSLNGVYGSPQFVLYNNAQTELGMLGFTTATFRQYSGSSVLKFNWGFDGIPGTHNILFDGNINICQNGAVFDADIAAGRAVLQNGARLNCSAYVPTSACNPVGFGTLNVTDSDQDGVINSLDDFPTDATRAFTITGASGTLLFEDMWPKKGDYDMNDVVIGYAYTLITDANNKVSQVKGDFSLRAAGGIAYQNGFGVEFPVLRSKVTSLDSATLETNQPNAVAILFSSAKQSLGGYNTRAEDQGINPKTFHIELNIGDGPSLAAFGLSSYNPFIFGSDLPVLRGKEIHLVNHPPTSLVNQGNFGIFDDASSVIGGLFYRTSTGLPWAVDVPDPAFKYPLEGKSIGAAYLDIADWAASGGTRNADWYTKGKLQQNIYPN